MVIITGSHLLSHPKQTMKYRKLLWLTFIWRISENLGVKHVLPIFLDIIRSSVKSIHKLPTTKAPNAALNGHDGEDIPGYRALTRHHISTPEKLLVIFSHEISMEISWISEWRSKRCFPWILHESFLFRSRNESNSDRNWWELGGSVDQGECPDFWTHAFLLYHLQRKRRLWEPHLHIRDYLQLLHCTILA